MAEYKFKMPDIGEGVVEAEITAWHVKVGDKVAEDDPVADAMTDKATVELTAPVSGVVTTLGCAEGEILAIGSDLVVFEMDGDAPVQHEEPKAEPKPAPEPAPEPKPAKTEKPTPAPKPAPVPTITPSAKPLASPAVRKAALDADIDLFLIIPSGKAGQITHEDLEAFLNGGPQKKSGSSGNLKRVGSTDINVVGMRRVISQRMQEAKRRIPHFSYVEAVDMTELEALRAHLNANREEHQPKLTLIPFFMRAICKATLLWPQCNATYDDEAGIVTQHHGVHMGMAAQTKNGLMVPVVHHAEALDVWQAAAEVARLAEAAKSGKIKPEELQGGSITLTSLGPLGGVVTTPVINRPEVAIIGPNKIVETPVVQNGQVVVRKMMNISSSFDHRWVDGFHAAEMIIYIKGLLEHPATLFMD
ncbi:MAG: 2-oxo acid dehydrogenase subunit E2 [Acidimicrobiales bacterium]|nr:2-oxo acid dehydrogenase subunit E2 [Hyphomonadaceae bacterium]RZV41847.1 MAG: 2-oxo acid dehydrogenase subunit E2 [Acidimicrobiales bacterium]